MTLESRSVGPETSVRLESLGRARLLLGPVGKQEEILGPGKPLALAVYLAASPGRSTRREQLVDLLWADAEPARARASLRQTLFHLRQLLGEGAVGGDANVIHLDRRVTFDRDEFLGYIEAGNFEESAKIYRGPFLPEFAVPGGSGFEEWADIERHRLALIHTHVLESLVRQRLEDADPIDAARFARRLRDANPHSESGWRLLLESLESSGQRVDVIVEADALERLIEADERTPEPATTTLLRRIRHRPATTSDDGQGPSIAADLIGREREFAAILAAWKSLRVGKAQSFAITGRAGLGKTRLLRDIERRLRASRACIAYVRARSGEDRVIGAFAADLARELADLPGALGISPGAASTLVALQPALSSRYSSVPDIALGPDALRRRTFALAELIESVAHEQPLTLLLDDLHWADPDSIRILAGAVDRLEAAKVLIVTTSREAGIDVRFRNGVSLALEPLLPRQLLAMLRSIATDEHGIWSDPIIDALFRGTGGTPLLVLDAVQLAMDRKQLEIEKGVWRCLHSDALEADFLGGGSIARRLDGLTPFERRLLTTAAVAGAPLRAGSFTRAINEPLEPVTMALEHLEAHGFVRRVRGEYEMAHDEIAATVLRCAAESDFRESSRLVGLAIANDPKPTASDYQRAARHLILAGDDVALEATFRAWLMYTAKLGDKRSDRELAIAMVGEGCPPAAVDRLLRSRPVSRRIGLRSRRERLAATALGLCGIAAALAAVSVPSKPTQLGVVVAPIAFGERLPPMPIAVVELQDARGRRVRRNGDSVSMEITGGGGVLGGKTRVAAADGRAVFPDVTIQTATARDLTVQFTAPGVSPTRVRITSAAEEHSKLQLVRATLNGGALTPLVDTMRIAPGDSIVGDVEFRYTSKWVAGALVLGVTSTWADRTRAYSTIGALTTPGEGVVYRGSVRLAGPQRAGTYRLVFAFQAEDAVGFVMSGTNWTVGAPVWNDGNDIADWTDAQFAQADRDGRVRGTILRTTGRYDYSVPAATIVVNALESNARRR